jgi:hypothetical protein
VNDGLHIITADAINNTQRTLLHQVVKENADDWWHRMPNVWVVKGGGGATAWRDRLRPIVPLAPSSVLVLPLRATGKQRWASVGPRAQIGSWLREALARISTSDT